MNIILNEQQYISLLEFYKPKPLSDHIRQTLKNIYEPLGKYGQVQDPDNFCETNSGVMDVYPVSDKDRWSILNWFDTNDLVFKQMEEWYTEENQKKPSTSEMKDWITKNAEKLFNGEWTQKLVDLNKGTIERGVKNEDYAITILQDKLGSNAKINRFCSGDVRDTKKGMDLRVQVGSNPPIHVQVKTLKKVESLYDDEGDTFFEVHSPSFDNSKYNPKNVDLFLFVDYDKKLYIGFRNKPNKIYTRNQGVARFYEPWDLTNINFTQSKLYKPRNKTKVEDDLFKSGERRLENLKFRKKQIQKLIDTELQKLNQLKIDNPEK